MGIDFADEGQKRAPVAISFFKVKENFRPQQLHGEVIPELIHKVGDWKTGRITQAQVEKYLDDNILVFDRTLLTSMFEEADYLKEGSVGERELASSLQGRYPKRYLTNEWRQLAALMLDVPQLVLTEDMVKPKTSKGTFNSETIWDSPPPVLPPIRRKGSGMLSASGSRTTSSSGGQNAAPDSTPAGNAAPPITLTAESLRSFDSSSSDAAKAAEAALRAQDAATSQEPPLGLPNLIYLKAKGYQITPPTEEEMAAYRAILKAPMGEVTAERPESWDKASDSKRELCSDAVHPEEATTSQAVEQDVNMCSTSTSILPGIPKQSLKAWNATLPPSCINVPSASLQTLRTTIKGTLSSKPEFLNKHRMLTATDMDRKTTLGQKVDVKESLARVEPVRSTTLRHDVGYVTAGDYAPNCPTAPSNWDVHPLSQAKEPSKYPWAEWN